MTAAELKYMMAAKSLCPEGGKIKVSELAQRMGVSKVSAYKMCERLEAQSYLRGGEGGVCITAHGDELLAEYTLCAAFVQDALERCCHTPKNIARREAVGIVCAVGDGSRAALLRFLKGERAPSEDKKE